MKIRLGIVGGVLLMAAGVLLAALGIMLTFGGPRQNPEFMAGLFASTGITLFFGDLLLALAGAFTFYIGLAPRPPSDDAEQPD